jgi:hypothetical protein
MRGWRVVGGVAEARLEEELARRLRELEWPKAPPEVRRRCWESLQARLTVLRP